MDTYTRRGFLGAALTAPLAAACAASATSTPPASGTLDIHVHLFGTGDDGTGCRLSDRVRNGLSFTVLMHTLGLTGADSIDRRYREVLLESVQTSGLDRAVILAQDAVYDSRGRRDDGNTHFFTPNDYVLETCADQPHLLVPCVSINPMRGDALEELERCHGRGARVLKIHPPTQGVDVADPRHRRFFARCAELSVLVMVHTGHEHAAPVLDADLSDPRRLRGPLEAGCRVVACHSGSGWPTDSPDFLPAFVEMLAVHPRLWGDTSVLGTQGRRRDWDRLFADPAVSGRLVHGSDFPFPANPMLFADLLGRRRALELTSEGNLLRRDHRLKIGLGAGETASRGFELVLG